MRNFRIQFSHPKKRCIDILLTRRIIRNVCIIAAAWEASVPDTVLVVARIDHTLQEQDIGIAVRPPDTLPAVPDIPAHMVDTAGMVGTVADMVVGTTYLVGTFVVVPPPCFEPNHYLHWLPI